ncbi:MAG: tyrosine-type recombinase/integrase [Ktedonobacteraceae bacterium]
MDKLETLRLFPNERWQQCLESFLDTLSRQVSHTSLVDHRATLKSFFTPDRDPAAVLRKDVETFCRGGSYHGAPSYQTVKRRRTTIRDFYDLAIKNGIYQGANPGRPLVVDRQAVPHLFDDPIWQQCFEHFLEDLYRRSQSSGTVVGYTAILRQFFQDKGDPAKVTRAKVSTFIQQPCASNGKHGQPVSVATSNKRCSCLRSFYQFASGYTVASEDEDPEPLFNHANPTANIRHGQPAQAYKSLSIPEIKAFFSVIPDSLMGLRDRSWAWTLLLTCRRRSEITALRWGSISHGMITSEDGSTHEGIMYTFRGKGRQAILDCAELPQKAYEEIRAYLIASGRWDTMTPESPIWSAIGPEIGGNVLPSEVRPFSAKGMAQRLKIYARLAGIPESRFSMHSMRHTGAFLRKISGEDLFSISHTLRHKSLDMTKRYLEGLTIANADNGSKLVEARLRAMGVM